MLSNLPIDALKLDMQFIRNAFKNGKNTHMLEIVIEIADSLNVPVIAEGVETAEQLFTLKSMGCEIVQGYYFSKPLPAGEFEEFLIEKKEKGDEVKSVERSKYRKLAHDRHIYDAMHDPVTGLYNSSAFDFLLFDSDKDHTALLLMKLSNFEDVLKSKGSSVANRSVVRVAEMLKDLFRASDFICRIRNDEIAIILSRIESNQRMAIENKVARFIKDIAVDERDIPGIDVNYGLVFGDDEKEFDLFKAADESLITNKEK
jgi:diguanylate cyclase (GGDEF)-like protein